MPSLQPVSDPISRQELIAGLRRQVMQRADGRSICSLAAEKNIFCHGFHRFSEVELRQRFSWLSRKRAAATLPGLERLADGWQLARQEVLDLPTSCDVQSQEHDLCNGWEDFSDADLAMFYTELNGDGGGCSPAPLPVHA